MELHGDSSHDITPVLSDMTIMIMFNITQTSLAGGKLPNISQSILLLSSDLSDDERVKRPRSKVAVVAARD